MNTLRKFLFALAVAAITIGLTQPSTAGEKVRAVVAHKGLWDTGITMLAAQQQGFFADEGLDVDLRFMRSAPEIIQTLIIGENDIAIGIGILAVIGAYGKGAPIRVVSAEITGNEYYWYALASSPINSMKDLGGRTVGHNKPGSAAHLSTLAMIAHAGVPAKPVVAGRMSDNLTQVLSGQIDVGYGLPPTALDRLEKNELKIVARGSEVPALVNLTLRVNAATADILTKRRDVVMKVIRARQRAIDWMYQNPDESWKIYALVNKISESIARRAFEFYPIEYLAPVPIKSLDWSIEQAVLYKFLEQPLTETQSRELVEIVYDPRGD